MRGLGLLCLYAQPVGGLGCRGLRHRCRRIRLRCALRKAAHVGAQLLQLGLSLVKGLIDSLRQTVQIQRGGAQPFIHAGQTLPHEHNARGDAAGILGHAGLLGVGLLLLFLAAAWSGYNILDARRADRAAQNTVEQLQQEIAQKQNEKEQLEAEEEEEETAESAETSADTAEPDPTASLPDYVLHPDMEMPVMKIDGNYYIGVLTIPSLDLSLPVMEDWDDEKLKISPCRYAGSLYQKNLVIAGHNYQRHFNGIRTLPIGSEIQFNDADGNEFQYTVVASDVMNPEEKDRMLEDGAWDLTLFTCNYGLGTRYAVRCQMVEENE